MKLFGTDGVRGIWGDGIFQIDELKKLTYSIVKWLRWKIQNRESWYDNKVILIGRDTRRSGKKIERIMVEVLRNNGFEVEFLGIMPTQIISYFSRVIKPIQAIAITASHNPPQYNGIKLIDNDGLKISCEDEEMIERIYNKLRTYNSSTVATAQASRKRKVYISDYNRTLRTQLFKGYLRNAYNCMGSIEDTERKELKIILDCADGATYKIAPAVFKYLGFKKIKVVNNSSNGDYINLNGGVMNIEKTVNYLKYNNVKFDFLVLFDGDGDRVYVMDEKFNLYNGDALLAVFTYYYAVIKKDKLKCVVGTVMSNSGLEEFCRMLGINFIRSSVGDRNVTLRVMKEGTFLGGESSGHIVNMAINSFGDGILNALLFTKIYKKYPQILEETRKMYRPYDTFLLNLPVKEKLPLAELKNFKEQIHKYEKSWKDGVRVVVRYSGTENALRIFVESRDKGKGVGIAEALKDAYLQECKLRGLI